MNYTIEAFLKEYENQPVDFLDALWTAGLLKTNMDERQWDIARDGLVALNLSEIYELRREMRKEYDNFTRLTERFCK